MFDIFTPIGKILLMLNPSAMARAFGGVPPASMLEELAQKTPTVGILRKLKRQLRADYRMRVARDEWPTPLDPEVQEALNVAITLCHTPLRGIEVWLAVQEDLDVGGSLKATR